MWALFSLGLPLQLQSFAIWKTERVAPTTLYHYYTWELWDTKRPRPVHKNYKNGSEEHSVSPKISFTHH